MLGKLYKFICLCIEVYAYTHFCSKLCTLFVLEICLKKLSIKKFLLPLFFFIKNC